MWVGAVENDDDGGGSSSFTNGLKERNDVFPCNKYTEREVLTK